MKTKEKETITLAVAAETLGIHEHTCRIYCQDGTLTATKKFNGRWQVDKESVVKLLNSAK